MLIKFVKLHGLGNDFICVDCLKERLDINFSKFARAICDRHFGVGSDGLLLVLPSESADFKMRIYNPDGSEAEMCGNGIRCFARYIFDHVIKKRELKIETLAGIKMVKMDDNKSFTVDMGEPIFYVEKINKELKVDNKIININCISLGNPHCVVFVKNLDFDIGIAKKIENHEMFPNRTNVEFVKVINKNEIKVRVWERGVGETLACGTGACASVIASVLNNKTKRKVKVHLLGGLLDIEWKKDNHVYMKGPAEEVFCGTYMFKDT